ncbi:MAG: HAMP domain-containing protein [Anaerolineaceae bacterium]|nr:HAMP domain-containing protein [Anaerolineaceae bacterium]
MNKFNNLRLRLVLWTITLECLLLVIFGVMLVVVIQKTQNQQIDESLRLSASQLNAVIDVRDGQFQLSESDRNTLSSQGMMAWIVARSGTAVLTVGRLENLPLPLTVIPNDGFIDSQLKNGEPIRLLVAPLSEGDHPQGVIVIAKSLRDSQVFIRQVMLGLGIAVPVLVLLSGAGGLFLANRALAPVATITRTARQISTEDLSRRLTLQLPNDEIGELAHTFDAMLERLEQGFQRERQLTADVSHELRTPLGILKTQLSLARSRPRDADTLLRMMANMEADVDRMTRLTEQTLMLTRVEQGGLVDLQPLDLGEILDSIVESWQAKAQACNVKISIKRDKRITLPVNGDPDRLYQVFSNLIDNAIKYTSPKSIIDVEANRNTTDIEVLITDSGIGIAPEHLPHIFERFYRADSARTTGGFGLGLAITHAIVQAHRGQLRVKSSVGHGTTFTVLLPLEHSNQS